MSGPAPLLVKHAAAGPYLGFALQPVRLCYYLLSSPRDSSVSLEYLDDVAVHYADGQLLLEQCKSALAHNPISDWSDDLWKTVVNWLDAVEAKMVDGAKTSFQLYVTPPKPGKLSAAMHAAADAKAEIGRKLENALNTIQDISGRLIPQLDGEWPDAPIRLVIQDLTVRVIRETRDDFLWEIGSGANWLAYHVALSLALQGYFLRLPQHPVPALLIYDQPSQVYFPARRAGTLASNELDPTWRNEDVVAVRKVFALFNDIIKKTEGRLQIIVLDHADEEVWGGLENIHPVEEWRGKGLVPEAWV